MKRIYQNIFITNIRNSGISLKFFSNKYCALTMDLSKYGIFYSIKTSNYYIKFLLFKWINFEKFTTRVFLSSVIIIERPTII